MNDYEYKRLLKGLIANATQDALSFGEVVSIIKHASRLNDEVLEDLVKITIGDLLEHGMQLVKAMPEGSEFLWFKHPDYMLLPKEKAVIELIAQWKAVDDYDFMVWFIPEQNLTDKPMRNP